jgi:hypothetical protein
MFLLYPLPSAILLAFAAIAIAIGGPGSRFETIPMIVVLGIAILQFPFYGFVLSYARLKISCWSTIAAGIIWVHMFGIAVWVVIAGVMWLLTRT